MKLFLWRKTMEYQYQEVGNLFAGMTLILWGIVALFVLLYGVWNISLRLFREERADILWTYWATQALFVVLTLVFPESTTVLISSAVVQSTLNAWWISHARDNSWGWNWVRVPAFVAGPLTWTLLATVFQKKNPPRRFYQGSIDPS